MECSERRSLGFLLLGVLHGMECVLWCLNLVEGTPWLRGHGSQDNDIESHHSGNLIWIVHYQVTNTRIFLSLFPANETTKERPQKKKK